MTYSDGSMSSRSPAVPSAGSFSVQYAGRPSSAQVGALVTPWSMLMKMARLAPSLSCNSCGTTDGLNVQTNLAGDDSGDIENVLDDLRQCRRIPLHGLERVRVLVRCQHARLYQP